MRRPSVDDCNASHNFNKTIHHGDRAWSIRTDNNPAVYLYFHEHHVWLYVEKRPIYNRPSRVGNYHSHIAQESNFERDWRPERTACFVGVVNG